MREPARVLRNNASMKRFIFLCKIEMSDIGFAGN